MPIASDVMEAQAANVLEEVEAHRRGWWSCYSTSLKINTGIGQVKVKKSVVKAGDIWRLYISFGTF
jgi:hypothetical protein